MSTFGQAIYALRERIRQHSDDSDFEDLYLLYELNIQRALYYRNEYNKNNRIIDDQAKQVICVELIDASTSESSCDITGCNILKSKKKIPKLLELHEKIALTNITTTDLNTIPFVYVPFSSFFFAGKTRFNKNSVYVTLNPNGHVFVKSSNPNFNFIEKILIYGIFEETLEALSYPEDCLDNYFEKKYPASAHVLTYILAMTADILVKKMQIPRDTTNNSFET